MVIAGQGESMSFEESKWEDLHRVDENSIQSHYPTDMLCTFVRHHINKQVGLVLDIGIGNGVSTEYFRDHTTLDIVAVDCSRTAIERAKDRLLNNENSTKRINLVEASFTKLPIENESVDYIYAQDCIYYGGMKIFQKAIREIERVLKPCGVIRFSVKTSNDRYANKNHFVRDCDYRVSGKQWENDLILYCPTFEELKKELVGFTDFSIGHLSYDYTGNSGEKSFFIVTLTK